jgi:hydrogenase maturation protein HypF
MNLALRLCREQNLEAVALSGGCFQNRLLLAGCRQWLDENPNPTGIRLYTHSEVPTNDGGLALGQAVAAAMIWRDKHE